MHLPSLVLGLALLTAPAFAQSNTSDDPLAAVLAGSDSSAKSSPATKPPPPVAEPKPAAAPEPVAPEKVTQPTVSNGEPPAPAVTITTVTPRPAQTFTAPAAAVPVEVTGGTQPAAESPKVVSPGQMVAPLAAPAATYVETDPLVKERARLRGCESFPARMRNGQLGAFIRMLADACGMNYIAVNQQEFPDSISLSVTANPLDLWDMLVENYELQMTFERGIWRFSRARADSLVTRSYTVHHNTGEVAAISSPTFNTQMQGSSGGSSRGGTSAGGSSASSSSSSSEGSGTIDVKGDLVKQIEELLATPLPSASATAAAAPKGKVLYIPDSAELIVMAPKFHHGLVEKFLETQDRAQSQIQFTAYFVETARDPSSKSGISWPGQITGTLSGSAATGTTSGTGTSGGTTASAASAISTPVDLMNPFNGRLPTAVLSVDALKTTLNFLNTDSESAVVQQPTIVGLNNRKVVFDATRQIPIANSSVSDTTGSSSGTGGGTDRVETSLSFLDVGTIVTLLPKVMVDENGQRSILVHASLVVSSLIGEKVISGNPVPLTAKRRFEFSSIVPEGSSLAIGGLTQSISTTSGDRVPGLSKVPLIGGLFRSNNNSASRSNLIVYITPTILDDVTKQVESFDNLPEVWPAQPGYHRERFVATDEATLEGAKAALAGLEREIKATLAYVTQKRAPEQIRARIRIQNDELATITRFLRSLSKQGTPTDHERTQAATLDALLDQARRKLGWADRV